MILKRPYLLLIGLFAFALILTSGCELFRGQDDGLEFDTLIEDTITSNGGTASYRLDATENQSIYLEVRDLNEGSLDIVLTDATDRELFSSRARDYGPGYGDVGPFTFREEGTYTLTLTADDDKSPSFAFIVWNIDPLVVDGGTVLIDELVSKTIAVPGQSVAYQLEVQAPQYFSLDVRAVSEGSLVFSMTTPDGLSTVFESTARDYGPAYGNAEFALETDGVYTLTLTARDADTPDFSFVLWEVDPVIDGGELVFDTLISGTVNTPGQVIDYTLDGTSGDTYYLDIRSLSKGAADFILTGPNGLEVMSSTTRDYGPSYGNVLFELQQDGAYTLQFNPRSTDTPTVDFVIWQIASPVVDKGNIAFGARMSDSFDKPGIEHTYTFDADVDQSFDLAVEDISDGSITFTLISPDGLEVFSVRSYSYNVDRADRSFTAEKIGTYTLKLIAEEPTTPDYIFTLTPDGEIVGASIDVGTFFSAKSADLNDDAQAMLEEMAEELLDLYGEAMFVITGYDAKLQLATDRAETIYNWFVAWGSDHDALGWDFDVAAFEIEDDDDGDPRIDIIVQLP